MLSFVHQCVFFKCLGFYPHKIQSLYIVLNTSFEPIHGNGVVYLTMLAPYAMKLVPP